MQMPAFSNKSILSCSSRSSSLRLMQQRILNIYMNPRKYFSWFKRHVEDQFVRNAQLLNYRSRAAFKLIEIDDKYRILSGARSCLDVGCAPGSWLQVASSRLSLSSKILGVDLLQLKPLPNVSLLRGDAREKKVQQKIAEFSVRYEIILSDMAPPFSGDKVNDHFGFVQLNQTVIALTQRFLKSNGYLVMKSYQGPESKLIEQALKRQFEKAVKMKPKASRSTSSQFFWIGLKFKDIK